jgi:hypothetical protein
VYHLRALTCRHSCFTSLVLRHSPRGVPSTNIVIRVLRHSPRCVPSTNIVIRILRHSFNVILHVVYHSLTSSFVFYVIRVLRQSSRGVPSTNIVIRVLRWLLRQLHCFQW